MTDENGAPIREGLAEEILSNLLITPEVFFSVMSETGFGIFKLVSGSAVMTASEVQDFQIVNPRGYWTLILKANVQPSSPIINFQLYKDLVADVDVSGFNLFNENVPNFYTPIRNLGLIRLTNLSAISTPSFSFYVQTLQVRTDIWMNIRRYMAQTMTDTIGLKDRYT